MPRQDGAAGNSRKYRLKLWVVVGALAVATALARPGAAAVVECASGDVACLIAAVNAANASAGADTIQLQPGVYVLTAPDNDTDGANGLPSITGPLTIIGAGPGNTIIEREATGPDFRLFHVAQTGVLKLQGVTVRGGRLRNGPFPFDGGGLLNLGTTIISQSAVTDSTTGFGPGSGAGGGIASLGKLVIAGSIISRNTSSGPGGGVSSRLGLLAVLNSTISSNRGDFGGGLFIGDGVPATIIGTTIADNLATDGSGGGVFSSSAVAIINSTLTGNRTNFGGGGLAGGSGIIVNTTIANNDGGFSGDALFASSALAVYNTIVSGSLVPFGPPACGSQVTSLGNNLFTQASCAVALLSSDLTGDPRLGDFVDDGTPGHGFLPLLRRSPALNAADAAGCLPTDQRGHRRNAKGCDIGAIEGVRP